MYEIQAKPAANDVNINISLDITLAYWSHLHPYRTLWHKFWKKYKILQFWMCGKIIIPVIKYFLVLLKLVLVFGVLRSHKEGEYREKIYNRCNTQWDVQIEIKINYNGYNHNNGL